jgi:hypothetical protein
MRQCRPVYAAVVSPPDRFRKRAVQLRCSDAEAHSNSQDGLCARSRDSELSKGKLACNAMGTRKPCRCGKPVVRLESGRWGKTCGATECVTAGRFVSREPVPERPLCVVCGEPAKRRPNRRWGKTCGSERCVRVAQEAAAQSQKRWDCPVCHGFWSHDTSRPRGDQCNAAIDQHDAKSEARPNAHRRFGVTTGQDSVPPGMVEASPSSGRPKHRRPRIRSIPRTPPQALY